MLLILVVDDDATMRKMLLEQLEAAGHRGAGADGFEAALARLRAGPWDAILTDIQMRGRDGFDLLRAAHQLRPELPVILMTSFATDCVARAAKQAGAYALLSKPFDDDQLLEVIERIPRTC